MTLPELDAIKVRADAATDVPWTAGTFTDSMGFESSDVGDAEGECVAHCGHSEGSQQNAEFIAHSRTDVPRLVAALEGVLELPPKLTRDMHSSDYNRGLAAAKAAIEWTLKEER